VLQQLGEPAKDFGELIVRRRLPHARPNRRLARKAVR